MVEEVCKPLVLTDQHVLQVANNLCMNIKKGLNKDSHAKAVIKCFPTFLQDLPTGHERGKYLALDCGSSNIRILLIHLQGTQDMVVSEDSYSIPKTITKGAGVHLFEFLAECVAIFAKKHKVEQDNLPLGFTFRFPVQQVDLSKGILVAWTKGFQCEGVVGRDVSLLLKDALMRRGDVQVELVALINDTTGCLVACAWKNHDCRIGVIIDDGCNACYVERVAEAQMFNSMASDKEQIVINTEWGALGDDGALDFIRTDFDRNIDQFSVSPGKHRFEKMISNLYLGELVRLTLIRLIQTGGIFKGKRTDALTERWKFKTQYLSRIESELPGEYTNCRQILDKFDLGSATEADCLAVRTICETVSKRSARLISCVIAVLINRVNQPHVTVAIDGNLYRYHPKFHDRLVDNIKKLVKPGLTYTIMWSEDGAGVGAALVAASTATAKRNTKHFK